MRGPLDDIVITSSNRRAFELVIGISQREEMPFNLYFYGPKGSGKSSVMVARFRERDLLSDRRILFTHAAELLSAVSIGLNEKLLKEAGSVDILLIDSLDDFYSNGEAGVELLTLLLKERRRLGLSTVIAGRHPLDEYDCSELEEVLNQYETIAVESLDDEGRILFASTMQDKYREGVDNAPLLTDAALSYIALDFSKELSDISNAIRYLVSGAGLNAGEDVSEEKARLLLAS